jgi:hypothetical protein
VDGFATGAAAFTRAAAALGAGAAVTGAAAAGFFLLTGEVNAVSFGLVAVDATGVLLGVGFSAIFSIFSFKVQV